VVVRLDRHGSLGKPGLHSQTWGSFATGAVLAVVTEILVDVDVVAGCELAVRDDAELQPVTTAEQTTITTTTRRLIRLPISRELLR
jgi:hypothetical protein